MIGVYAERISVAFMSSAADVNALRMISVVIGSTVGGGHSAPLRVRHQERPEGIDAQRVAGRDDRRRGLLLDDAGPSTTLRASWSRRDDRRVPASPSEDRRRGDGVESRAAGVERLGRGAAEVAESRAPHDDELDRRAGVRVPVARLVRVVEALRDARRSRPRAGRRPAIVSVYSWPT